MRRFALCWLLGSLLLISPAALLGCGDDGEGGGGGGTGDAGVTGGGGGTGGPEAAGGAGGTGGAGATGGSAGTGGPGAAAGSDGPGADAATSSGGGAGPGACQGAITDTDTQGNPLIIAKNAQNYSFSTELIIETTPVKSMSDLTLDWSAVTKDMRLRDLNPLTGIDMVEIIVWENISQEDLLERFSTENVDLAYLLGLVLVYTENTMTTVNLLDMYPPAGELTEEELFAYVDTELRPPESHVYVVMLAEGETFGEGTLMMHFIRPDPDETNTVVNITNDSTKLNPTVDLHSLEKIAIPPDTPNIRMAWTDDTVLSVNALGNEFLPNAITQIMIGHYPDMTVSDIEANFLDVDGIAEDMWTADLPAGTSISLSELVNEEDDNAPFPGINDEGTWLVGLICGRCTSPAPWFLSVLEPCSR